MSEWPILTRYDAAHLRRITLPLGGIGTGTIGLGGDGSFRDFELGSLPAKGFRPEIAFAAIRTKVADKQPQARALQGPVDTEAYEGAEGSTAPHHGLPRFRHASFDGAYPFGQVNLNDPDMPVAVKVQAFNPFIPTDTAASSLPVILLRYDVQNLLNEAVETGVSLSFSNFVGANGTKDDVGANVNTLRSADAVTGLVMSAPGLEARHEAAGQFAMAVRNGADRAITTRTGWADRNWGDSLLDFWDDFLHDGQLQERISEAKRPVASLCQTVTVPAGETRTVEFLLSWAFPNRRAWRSGPTEYGGAGRYTDYIVGNHYTEVFPDPWETITVLEAQLPELERRTVEAISAIVASSAPKPLLEAALNNLSTLRSPTVFHGADGRFYGWEGVLDKVGSCLGTCTHVWGYEFATSYLFAEIAASFRDTQFSLSTDSQGLMSFRTGIPETEAQNWRIAAADGQMASLVHLYVDWQLSGDDAALHKLWPAAKRALEFCWIPGGWDADQDGVMEGAQHNTMDVEYYGPNPQMGAWYLAALRGCATMAAHLGEQQFADKCRELLDRGSKWMDAKLFNGSYYIHEIRPLKAEDIAPGLRDDMGAQDLANPELQLGHGCLIDQLVGQYAAHVSGMGHLLDQKNVRAALNSVFERNFKSNFHDHFNHMRSYVLGDEAGLLMCTYDAELRPERPFPYFNEVMTGFEYTAAVGLIQEGERDKGLSVITAIRNRYDGYKRNPFNEAECGHHYARAMAAWSSLLAWTGFRYSAVTGTMAFTLEGGEGQAFWSTGSSYGTWQQKAGKGVLRVLNGTIRLERLEIAGNTVEIPEKSLSAGQHISAALPS